MNTLLIILIVLVYIAIGVAISVITHGDVLSGIVLFWVVILVAELGREFANVVIYCIERIEEALARMKGE